MTPQELREKRQAKAQACHDLNKQYENKAMPKETIDELNALIQEVCEMDERIEMQNKILDIESDRIEREKIGENGKSKTDNQTAHALLNKWMAGGDKAITAEEWQTINNALSTTVGTEGQYTIQTDVAKSVLDALKAFGGMRQVATVIQTAQGNPLNYPTSDGTSEEGEEVAENEEVSDGDFSFGVKTLGARKFSSKVVPVPIELLQDSSIDLEAFVNKRLNTRLHRTTNRIFTTGATGLITLAGTGATAVGTTSIAYNELIDLEHSVDPAYREGSGCGWMFSDAVLKLLKKMKDSDGRPIWLPHLSKEAPATILNYKYTINQNVAAPVANAKSVAFGDMSHYVIRDVMDLTYHRFTDSAYAKKGQVGFLVFLRSDGNLMDVGGAVKCLQMAA